MTTPFHLYPVGFCCFHPETYSKVHAMLDFFPQTVWLTLGVLTVIVKGRGVRSEVADGIRRYFRAFVLACACFVAIYVLSDVSRPTRTGFTCEFS